MSKKLLLMLWVLLFLLVITLTGCASAPKTTDETDVPLPSILNIGTHPVGTLFNALGSGHATVLSNNSPYEVRAIATSGPVEWFPSLLSGEIDMGVLNTWDAKMGHLGEFDYGPISEGKGFPVRLLTIGSPAIQAPTVAADSGITKAADLKGKRYVGVYTGSAGITAQAKAFLANHNLSEKDIVMISVPGVNDGVNAITEKRADCTGSSVLGMAVIEELNATRGARHLSFDPSPDAVKRMQDEFPGYLVEVEPGPTGVLEPIYMMAYDIYLVARVDLPDSVAYDVVKTLWEFNEELYPIHPGLKNWTTDRFVAERATVPYHPGAIKYFKERGIWNDEMETVQNKLLTQGP